MMLSTSTRALVARGRVSVPSIQTLMRHCTSSTGTTSRRSSSTTTTTDTANKDTSHELLPHRGKELIRTRLRRLEVIHDPSINRGTAFSADERERLGLRGLVPPRRQYLDQQVMRIMKAFDAMSTPLGKQTRSCYGARACACVCGREREEVTDVPYSGVCMPVHGRTTRIHLHKGQTCAYAA